jgi:ApbE superfamily uncharacterized protein (UPF0280 family)
MMRLYRTVSCKESHLRVATDRFDELAAEVTRQRALLEAYIERDPGFRCSLVPVGLLAGAPEIAQRMHRAAALAGVGPMAAVAGAIAQMAAEAALNAGASEAIVENGGDIYLFSPEPVMVALYTGSAALGGRLAFLVTAEMMPLSICSSSGRMGHSVSLGDCDLATVVSADACLADAVATRAGNAVRCDADLEASARAVAAIAGVSGAVLVRGQRIALAGQLPRLVRNADPATRRKITRDRLSGPVP